MAELVVMCGLPGAGKTTFAKMFAKKNGYRYISIDNFYQAVFGNETEHYHKYQVWEMLYKALDLAIEDGVNVILDTNAPNPSDRSILFDKVGKRFSHRTIVYIENDPNTCKENNKHRSRVIPDDQMDYIIDRFVPPTKEELKYWQLQTVNKNEKI